ncbi:MAG: hypothetical protein M3N82_08070 [Pseudomonadota bacterium]|nr:hypothetical protein [Pseudomonadota bacterium]
MRVRGITVDSPHGPTHDGIDVVDGRDILIEGNTIDSGDEGICLKSGSATPRQLHAAALTRRDGVAGRTSIMP